MSGFGEVAAILLGAGILAAQWKTAAELSAIKTRVTMMLTKLDDHETRLRVVEHHQAEE